MLKTKESLIDIGKICKKSKEQPCKDLKTNILKQGINKISDIGIIQLALAELVDDLKIKYELTRRAQI